MSKQDLIDYSHRQREYISTERQPVLGASCMVYVIDLKLYRDFFDVHMVEALVAEAKHPRHRIIRTAFFDDDAYAVFAECRPGVAPSYTEDSNFQGFISSTIELLLRGQYFPKRQ